jgi:hypothetical protein
MADETTADLPPASVTRFLLPEERLRLLLRQLPIPLAMHLAAMLGGLLAAIAVSEIPGIAASARLVAWILWVFLAARHLDWGRSPARGGRARPARPRHRRTASDRSLSPPGKPRPAGALESRDSLL